MADTSAFTPAPAYVPSGSSYVPSGSPYQPSGQSYRGSGISYTPNAPSYVPKAVNYAPAPAYVPTAPNYQLSPQYTPNSYDYIKSQYPQLNNSLYNLSSLFGNNDYRLTQIKNAGYLGDQQGLGGSGVNNIYQYLNSLRK